MSDYEKTVSMSREEEGMYHRRQIEHVPATSRPQTTTYTVKSSKQIVPKKATYDTSDDDNDNYEEWTTSKRKVNHKTRQVETRVSRQLLVEDGKVIADSGPQVTTRIKEDNKVEECEKEKAPKNKSRFEALEMAPECGEASGRVLGEKKEIQRVSREVREENMQYHDERFKELTGQDVHRRAIKAPHELITINDDRHSAKSAPRGKMVHYSNKGKKYQDTDEILEVAKLAIDGSITKEVKRTKHHEEFSEDEKPDETGEAEELRKAPVVTRSGRRHVDYVNDFDDTNTPDTSDNDETTHTKTSSARRHKQLTSAKHRHSHDNEMDTAFPRYEVDPLLNQLNDEDYRPQTTHSSSSRQGRGRNVRVNRKDSTSSDDEDRYRMSSHYSPSPARHALPPPVEIPEEYRVHKSKGSHLSSQSRSQAHKPIVHTTTRTISPEVHTGSHKKASYKGSELSHRSRKEDASVQAHLTDEEEERRSMRSSSSLNSHEKAARHLQRQSTANSSRNYYYGERRHSKNKSNRRASVSSTSSSSLTDPKEQMRKNGARSRDSGFKSPHSVRTETPVSNQIYSVSSKSKKRMGATSPTPTTGSAGQRSVKTTTTTMSAGLADRPLSRQERSAKTSAKSVEAAGKQQFDQPNLSNTKQHKSYVKATTTQTEPCYKSDDGSKFSFDTVSLSSLGPNATTIKVPYRRIENEGENNESHSELERQSKIESLSKLTKSSNKHDDANSVLELNSEMSLQEDIASLSKRLASISRQQTASTENQSKQHFDYKTVIANVQATPIVPRQQQTIDAYNVRVIEHKSPFHNDQQPLKSVCDLSNSIARLELLSSQADLSSNRQVDDNKDNVSAPLNCSDNNNEANFNLSDFVKYKAMPVMVEPSLTLDGTMDDDGVSIVSSCSLKSSRTYDIKAFNTQEKVAQQQDEHSNQETESNKSGKREESSSGIEFDEFGENKRSTAWIFDPIDNSSTVIAPQLRPKKSETPKVDSKTEELVQSRGGRSYYLELVDPNERVAKRQRPSSMDSLYSRWNSQGALNNRSIYGQQNNMPDESRRSRQMKPATVINSDANAKKFNHANRTGTSVSQVPVRRQLPFSGPVMSNRSKSSSCLLSVTKPSKYSIYGGFRRPGENKPVPRLSYSRAIGPKSQRQLDAQSKTPSRYIKMR